MSFFFIINPKAGSHSLDIAELVKKEVAARRVRWGIAFTENKGHGTELARRALIKGYHNIVAAGGDGTVREIAQTLIGREENLCVLPCGSGNGLARNLFIPLDIERALEGIFSWKPRKIDAGLAGGEPFFCAAGFGLDARVARLFNTGSRRRGILPYVYFSLKTFFRYEPEKIRASFNGEERAFRPLVFAILNGREYGGGAKIAPNARMDDGYFNIICVRKPSLFRSLRALPDLFNGSLLEHGDIVKEYLARAVEVRTREGDLYHLDGEDFISPGSVKFTVLEKAINVKAP